MTAVEKINFLQTYYSDKYGIDFFDINELRRQVEPDLLNTILSKLESTAQNQILTDQQNPIEIYEILETWDLVLRANQDDISKIERESLLPKNIVIGTALTGNLNANAVKGLNETYGILFENDLIWWAFTFSSLIADFLLRETDQGIVVYHPKDERIFEGRMDSVSKLLSLIFNTIYTGRTSMEFLAKSDNHMINHLSELVRQGFLSFILAHEFAHLTKNHHSLIEKKGLEPPYFLRKNYDEIFKIYASNYQGIFRYDMKELVTKMHLQGIELDADFHAYNYAGHVRTILPPLKEVIVRNPEENLRGPENFNIIFHEIGIQLFLWSIEMLERGIRTLTNGKDGREYKLFSVDFDIQDLTIRTTHPCPMTRIRTIVRSYGHLPEAVYDMLESLFSKFWSIAYPKFVEKYNEGARPHEKWIDEQTELSSLIAFWKSG